MLTALEVTSRTRSHVVQVSQPRFAARPEGAWAFLAMRSAAAKDGFDLLPFSSFRDYATQLRIWNQKFWMNASLRALSLQQAPRHRHRYLEPTGAAQSSATRCAVPRLPA